MRGFTDRFNTTIAGWAFDPERPESPVEVSVSHGADELYRCKADLFRSDLVPILGSGNYGFSFDPENIDGFIDGITLTVKAHGAKTVLVLKEAKWIRQSLVAEGLDGWLFLQNDSNDVNQRMAGLVGNDTSRINETAMIFVTRQAMLSKLGIAYCAVVIPEKNVVCAKYWNEMCVSDSRPVPRILAQTQAFGYSPLYPIAGLLDDPDRFFLKTDTHLTVQGYEQILSEIKSELPAFFEGIVFTPRVENPAFCGDLGIKLIPHRTEVSTEFKFPCCVSQHVLIDQVSPAMEAGKTLRGSVIHVKSQFASDAKLLIFGTSSAYHFIPLVSQFFSEVLFVWENTFDYALIQRFAPDCVLWLASERFLPTGCNDMFGLPETLAFIRENCNFH